MDAAAPTATGGDSRELGTTAPGGVCRGNPVAVGASLLAKNSQAPRLSRKHALSLTFFASKLAPTGF
ncbi:hypothetical protein DK871_22760 [Pseudomonas sp. L13]|nr:hypothetical protein [Pseudomonas sp. L13]